jgi:copper chaperone
MISFQVNDMTCRHCVGAITHAIQSVEAGATVRIDLATHRVDVDCGHAHAEPLRRAIEEAGYTPVPIESPIGGPLSSAIHVPNR